MLAHESTDTTLLAMGIQSEKGEESHGGHILLTKKIAKVTRHSWQYEV